MSSTEQRVTIDLFFDQARKGRLTGLKCDLGHITVPPRYSCRVCLSEKLQPIELSGRGEVVSFTEVHVKSKEFPLDVPYTLALVTLVEGGNLMGVLRGFQSVPKHGSKVLAKFEDPPNNREKWPRTFFDPL
ncbi:MAG TPA: OB-fold domain-containing protein [Nitrososphaerales archaeon]|nr:OB-fold domain-containing protein [Nitrososphaerales archaeon]